jgi:Ca2+-binding RTX toxin-like protein
MKSHIESVEARVLFANAAVAATLAGGTLTVTGTAGNDAVTIDSKTEVKASLRRIVRDDYVVSVDGKAVASFRKADVSRINVDLGAGNDTFKFGTADQPLKVLKLVRNVVTSVVQNVAVNVKGGAGDDVLTGTAGNELLDGGTGHDKLVGNGGADQLVGGDGNDALIAGLGNATMLGGAGDDVLFRQLPSTAKLVDLGKAVVQGGTGKDLFASNLKPNNDKLVDLDSVKMTAKSLNVWLTPGRGWVTNV